MFLFTNDQHWARCGPRNAFGGAANVELFPFAKAVCSHHDEIDIKLFGRFDDLVRCNSGAKYGVCPYGASGFLQNFCVWVLPQNSC